MRQLVYFHRIHVAHSSIGQLYSDNRYTGIYISKYPDKIHDVYYKIIGLLSLCYEYGGNFYVFIIQCDFHISSNKVLLYIGKNANGIQMHYAYTNSIKLHVILQ